MTDKTPAEATETQATSDDNSVIVFQCSNCRKIVGDSTAWAAAVHNLNIIALYDLPDNSVTIDKQCQCQDTGLDVGCTFQRMKCAGCNDYIGRMYKTTNKELDVLRDVYSLEVAFIEIYTIDLSGRGKRKVADSTDSSMINKLNVDMTLMQGELAALSTRVGKLEVVVDDHNEEVDSGGSLSPYDSGGENFDPNIMPPSQSHSPRKKSKMGSHGQGNSRRM